MESQFNYDYSALSEAEKREVESIKKEYEPKINGQSKLEEIRKLNKKVNDTASVTALSIGIIACLIFGLGLAMILEWDLLVWGSVVAVIGFIPMALTYRLYNFILTRNKKKYGDKILKLSQELLSENN